MTTTTSELPEPFDLRSHNTASDKISELLRLFPEIRTEGGKLDFDRLKLALGESVDVGRERYGMNWPGKADCFKTIQAPSMGTLRPCREESVNFDTTENLIIEGDNLEVLKLLQKSYLGKVKMIYIDPPYNTGNDFIYPDNYSESLNTYLQYTGQVDDEGRKFGSNTEADGRFHSKWMNMMYPRLYLARNLLREDGVIFVSIDDSEVENLRKLLNEIFGEENFLASVCWQKKYAPANDKADFSASHDYILVFAKARPIGADGKANSILAREPRSESMDSAYQNPDNDARGPWKAGDYTCNKSSDERPNLYYSIVNPVSGVEVFPRKTRVWAYSRDAHENNVNDNRVWWGLDGTNQVPAYKRFLSEVGGVVAQTVWLWNVVGHTDESKKELTTIFEEATSIFETPKPTKLIKRMLSLATLSSKDDLVLDFFAGSGSTAHAVLEMGIDKSLPLRFILVQLPEPTERLDFPTIADITKERVRRVIKKIEAEQIDARKTQQGMLDLNDELNASTQLKLDLGFRVFKLDQSNFNAWNSSVEHDSAKVERQLDLHIDHIRDNRTPEDILYELLLKSGFPLTTPVEQQTIEGKTVYSIAGGALMICLDGNLTLRLIRAIAELKPERVVFLDEGFAGNDQLKANAVQTFKTKGVASFRTV